MYQETSAFPFLLQHFPTIVRNWKQPTFLPNNEWIKRCGIQWNIIYQWERRKTCHLWKYWWNLKAYVKWNKLDIEIQILHGIFLDMEAKKYSTQSHSQEQRIEIWLLGPGWHRKYGDIDKTLLISNSQPKKKQNKTRFKDLSI